MRWGFSLRNFIPRRASFAFELQKIKYNMEITLNTKINIEKVAESRIKSVDLDNVPFGKVFSDHMLVVDYANGEWGEPSIVPYGKFLMSPSVSALHYGQSIFEGMKAFKNQEGEPVLFRPVENFIRMNRSAKRMCMPEIPENIFMDGLKALVKLDQNWIPTKEGCSLYLRPFMFATDEYVGIRPSDTYRFIIFSCPVGAYYPDPVSLMVTSKYVRAGEGGTGEAKAAGNYAASLKGGQEAKDAGYTNVLWLDAKTHSTVEEVGTMNVFFIIDGVAVTPELSSGTILHGTTRTALIVLLREMGIEVQVRKISIKEIWEAGEKGLLNEAFGAGTAATVAHIDRIGHDGTVESIIDRRKEIVLPPIEDRTIAPALLKKLNDIRRGLAPDPRGWVVKV